MLDVCLLGTGGMMPLPNRWLSSLLVRYNGKMMLFDCGEGTQIPIRMLGWGFKSIDTICFTHYHADHISGLPGLLLTIGNSGREEPLNLIGPPGLIEVVKGLMVISPELPFEIRLVEISESQQSQININDLEVISIPVDHAIACLAYSINLKRQGKFNIERAKELNIPINYWKLLQKGEKVTLNNKTIYPEMVLGRHRKGIKLAYCTDTRPINSLVEFISESDLLICEGMYGDQEDQTKAIRKHHMTFQEAALLAKKAKVKELWLTHYSPSLIEPNRYIESIKGIFESCYAGHDLMTKHIKFYD